MFAKVRKDGAYLLPVATQFETEGSVTASNRSLQWREKVIDPLFESRTDHMIMYQLAQKLGFADQFIGKKDGKQNIAPGEGQGRHGRAVDGRHAAQRDQRAAAGPSATPASRPSACRRTCATCTCST